MGPARFLLILFAVTAWPAAAAAQQRACALKVESAPELRGFRLGMPLSQVKARFPGALVRGSEFGLSSLSLDMFTLRKADGAAFSGVSDFGLEFLDEQLVRMTAQYDGSAEWKDPDQFAARVSEALKLPAAWEGVGGESRRQMNCGGFLLSIHPNHIEVRDAAAYQTLRERREEFKDRRRQEFRP